MTWMDIDPEAKRQGKVVCRNLWHSATCEDHEKGACQFYHPVMNKKGICSWFQRADAAGQCNGTCGREHIALGEVEAKQLKNDCIMKARRGSRSPGDGGGQNNNSVKQPCRFFKQGTCNRGNDCRFSHE